MTSFSPAFMTRILGSLLLVAALAAGRLSAADALESAKGRPTLFLIGDSTVKNGTAGNGAGGLWGWGHPIADHFDPAKIKVENRALGGRSSRSFFAEGLWEKVLADMQSGDFVIIQFGHNDGGNPLTDTKARGSIKGTGEETQEATLPSGRKETVHSFGWYLRRYITDTKAKGATPIVCSLKQK